jgi:hypothetical protein
VRYLERELEKRMKLGKAVAVAGLAVALTTASAGCDELLDGLRPTGGAVLPPEEYEHELGGAPMPPVQEQVRRVPSQKDLEGSLQTYEDANELCSYLIQIRATREEIYEAWKELRICTRGEYAEIYELPVGNQYVSMHLAFDRNGKIDDADSFIEPDYYWVPDIDVAVARGEDWTRERLVGQKVNLYGTEWDNETWEDAYFSARGKDGEYLYYAYAYFYKGQDMVIFLYCDEKSNITDVVFGPAWIPSLTTIAVMGEEWTRDQLIRSEYNEYVCKKLWKDAERYIDWNYGSTLSNRIVMVDWTYMGQEKTMYIMRDGNNNIFDVYLSDIHIPAFLKISQMEEAEALALLDASKVYRDILRGVWINCTYNTTDSYDEYHVSGINATTATKVRVYFNEVGRVRRVEIINGKK